MEYTENALNILTVKSYQGIGNAWIVNNLQGNETKKEIVDLLNKKYKSNLVDEQDFDSKKERYRIGIENKFHDCCDGMVAWGDANFPKHRGNVKNSKKPIFLYYKGNINLLDINNKNITVIGLLNPKNDIEQRERIVVAEFVKQGATIVSGLAFGCDSIAHKQALDSNGKTIAILPSPLNKILPARNTELAHKIVEDGGLLITEYGSDFKNKFELSKRYKERDRLQALYCDTIVLAASYAENSSTLWKINDKKLDCGARLAMADAKEYGVPRAVMYDKSNDENEPMFDLNREIIGDDKSVSVITQGNCINLVKKIMNKNRKKLNEQPNLFAV